MTKSLKTIQVLSKIAKIFSRVLYILCMIGGISCLVGIVLLIAVQGLQVEGETVRILIERKSEVAMSTIYFSCATGFVACLVECILCKFAYRYFDNELKAGTPFTEAGSEEIRRLGILTIVLPLAALIVQGIMFGIFKAVAPETSGSNMEITYSAGLGIMFIILSVIFKYGAELSQKPNE